MNWWNPAPRLWRRCDNLVKSAVPEGCAGRGSFPCAPEDHDRVFQRFWRGDPAESRAQGRSGLGLTIVRQIAEAHGGEVKLASVPGHGAAFAIWLPGVPAPPSADEVVEPS